MVFKDFNDAKKQAETLSKKGKRHYVVEVIRKQGDIVYFITNKELTQEEIETSTFIRQVIESTD